MMQKNWTFAPSCRCATHWNLKLMFLRFKKTQDVFFHFTLSKFFISRTSTSLAVSVRWANSLDRTTKPWTRNLGVTYAMRLKAWFLILGSGRSTELIKENTMKLSRIPRDIKILQATYPHQNWSCNSGVLIVPQFRFINFKRSFDLKTRWLLAHTIFAETKSLWDLHRIKSGF